MLLKVLEINESNDGPADCKVEYGEEFKNLAKSIYKRKRFTKKLMKKAILDGLAHCLKHKEIKNEPKNYKTLSS